MGRTGWRVAALLAGTLVLSQSMAADKPKADKAAATPAAPASSGQQPTGFGKAKFGMSLAEVWKMYPTARLLGEEEQAGAPVVDGPYIDRILVKDQPVPGFAKPTMVEMRFWKDKLWAVIVYFGDNDPEKSKAYLESKFGNPTSTDGSNPTWVGEKVTSTASYMERWYGTSDVALSKQAQAWFGEMITGNWKGETPEEKAAREKRMAALTPKAGKAANTPKPTAAPAK